MGGTYHAHRRAAAELLVRQRCSPWMLERIRSALTWLGVLTARPVAFAAVFLYGIAWLVLSPKTLDWQGVVSMLVWMMTVIIQRAEHRDTQAIHAKLDDLLKAIEGADDKLSGVDKLQPEDIEKLRDDAHTAV
jgi:low affinity Fe/Cu permease